MRLLLFVANFKSFYQQTTTTEGNGNANIKVSNTAGFGDLHDVDAEFEKVYSDIKNNRIQTYTDQDLTFVVPKGSVECFGIETEQLEDVENEKGFFEFDVTKGGFEMTIDCWITEVAEEINDEEVNPDSKLYSKRRKQTGSFELPWNGNSYQICFSNKFSLLYDKTVYLSIERKYETDPKENMDGEQLLKAAKNNLASSLNLLTHLEVKSLQDTGIIEAAEKRIQFWSFIFTLVVIFTTFVSATSIKNCFANLDRQKSNA